MLILMPLSTMLVAQVPRDTSYTLANTVAKHRKYYPQLDVQGVMPVSPESVDISFAAPYKALDDRELTANLFSPKEITRAPAVLLIHGGGWRAGLPELMTPIAEQLAVSGYFVMVPEYRLSLEAAYPAAVEDLKDAISWMKEHQSSLDIDSNRIAVIGCSAGGQLAALLGTTTPLKAIVDIDGVLAFKHPDSEEGTMAAQWLGGSYEEKPGIWEEASALAHVSRSTPPTLFLASKYPRFLAGHQEFMDVLNVSGVYTEMVQLDNAPHSFWLMTPWFEPTIKYIIDFLNKTLQRTDY